MVKKENPYARACQEAIAVYGCNDYREEMKFIIESDTWTIDRIVIIGLGVQWYHLAMILHLREILEIQANKEIEVYVQEILDDFGPKDYVDFLKSREVTCLNIEDEMSAGPIDSPISSTTLLYAPWCIGRDLVELLRGKDPELFIGLPMSEVATTDTLTEEQQSQRKGLQGRYLEKRGRKRAKARQMPLEEDLREVARNFTRDHEWKPLPPTAPIGHKIERDGMTAGYFEGLFMYRKRGVWSQGSWTREVSDSDDGTDIRSSM
ncbi:hypothetical protein E2P81_ATG02481 [Venturia nashicola]|uniref:SRR1-like domain-containing protein n=1 Tax=Venturia nashicola TaxID=86259 RepID=A0A4Z1P7C1_9PEZI|nr:hypothetical protein E6O75_ATG02540 [Venturia nashicola]TLD36699.1 hypothetical protein E2P81_ATG02481 [Venturia nashicola]